MKTTLWFVAISLAAFAILQRSFRGSAVRRLEGRLGLKPAGHTLPQDLNLGSASFFAPSDGVSNVLVGSFENRQTAVFDFHANHGDMGYTQTVVAMTSKAHSAKRSALWEASEIRCEKIGDWIILYREREEVPVKAMPEFLTWCSQLVQHLEANQYGVVTSTPGE